jgi:hypothetical protein
MIDINEVIRHLGWEKAHKTEEVIKALTTIGINPKNCFFDDKDNLIIPCSEVPDLYPMCQSQDAQIDCRRTDCLFYAGAGKCTNGAPAITLNPDKTCVCWSHCKKPNKIHCFIGTLENEILEEFIKREDQLSIQCPPTEGSDFIKGVKFAKDKLKEERHKLLGEAL